MKLKQSQFQSIIEEYDCVSSDVLDATYDNFNNSLQRFLKLLNENNFLSDVINSSLPDVNFHEWYDSKETQTL